MIKVIASLPIKDTLVAVVSIDDGVKVTHPCGCSFCRAVKATEDVNVSLGKNRKCDLKFTDSLYDLHLCSIHSKRPVPVTLEEVSRIGMLKPVAQIVSANGRVIMNDKVVKWVVIGWLDTHVVPKEEDYCLIPVVI